MSLDDGLSKFLGSLYEAVLEEESWRAAIAEILRRSGSHRAIVASVDLRRRDLDGTQFHGPESKSVETGISEYTEEMSALDPTLEWAIENPHAGICDSAAVVPAGDYSEQPFIKWWQSRFGTLHWRVFYSAPVDDLSFGLSLHAPPDAGPPTREQLPLQALLFENLERAVRLAARPPNFAADDSALIAVDSAGRPLSLSQRAEEILREGDGLVITDGLLSAQSDETAKLLQRAIHAAIDPGRGAQPGRGVRIRRRNRRSDLLVVVSHFPPSVGHLPRPVATALVRVIELDNRPEHLSEHSHLFHFSPRETEIASALVQGHSIDSMAASLGISRNTARNHVQALFQKTRTNRQADLIRVLDRIARQ
jgi:DNA-binding CsgD family transcriptional regulator